jgi:hypothetical protein
MATAPAQIVRQVKLAAIGAFLVIHRRQRMVAAPHVTLRGRRFSLRDSHPGTCSNRQFMMRERHLQWSPTILLESARERVPGNPSGAAYSDSAHSCKRRVPVQAGSEAKEIQA